MNFLSLHYFRIVAEELNITHAAEKLYLTQQALSSHIRKIEEEYGVELFSRNPRLALTDAGRNLYETVKVIEDATTDLNNKFNEIRSGVRGDLRVGISFTRGQFVMPAILSSFSLKYPHVHVQLFEHSQSTLVDLLVKNEIDFHITASRSSLAGLAYDSLFSEGYYLVVPKKVLKNTFGAVKAAEILEKLKKTADITLVKQCPFIVLNPGNRSRELLDGFFRVKKAVPNIFMETENSQTAFALSQKELGITLYSDMFLKNYSGTLNPDVEFISLDKVIDRDTVYIGYNTVSELTGFRKDFLTISRENSLVN